MKIMNLGLREWGLVLLSVCLLLVVGAVYCVAWALGKLGIPWFREYAQGCEEAMDHDPYEI